MRRNDSSAEETSKRVHGAAARLFAEKGFAATGLRELADAAGLTPAALYHYMSSKDDLLVAVMKATIEPLSEAAHGSLAKLQDPAAKLGTLVETHVWAHGSRPLQTTVADSELRALRGEQREQVIAIRDRYEALWRQTLREGVESGRFEVDDVRLASIAILELCTGVAHWYVPGGRRALLELCAMHVDWAFGVVRASEGEEPLRRADLDLPSPAELFPPGETSS